MKICWIAPNGGNYYAEDHIGSGGWIGALEKELLSRVDGIELSIIFPSHKSIKPRSRSKINYYPIYYPSGSKLSLFVRRSFPFLLKKSDERFIEDIYDKIKEIQPDIVHVWGVEHYYSRIVTKLSCPYVVHIQGLASSIYDYFLPHTIGVTELSDFDGFFKHFIMHSGLAYKYYDFRKRVQNELDIAGTVKNWIGRTEWDRIGAQCLNKNSRYFHCDELMRDEFKRMQWNYHYDECLNITSIVGEELYKGVDVVLKTALLLKQMNVNFRWQLYGISRTSQILKFFERRINIKAEDVNVACSGSLPSQALSVALLDSDLYVHPSYIENSSNAIAEAMSLGLPIIAMYTGGNPTMLDGGTGILSQPGDTYMLAYNILQMTNREYACAFAEKAFAKARARHDSSSVVNRLMDIYNIIING